MSEKCHVDPIEKIATAEERCSLPGDLRDGLPQMRYSRA